MRLQILIADKGKNAFSFLSRSKALEGVVHFEIKINSHPWQVRPYISIRFHTHFQKLELIDLKKDKEQHTSNKKKEYNHRHHHQEQIEIEEWALSNNILSIFYTHTLYTPLPQRSPQYTANLCLYHFQSQEFSKCKLTTNKGKISKYSN